MPDRLLWGAVAVTALLAACGDAGGEPPPAADRTADDVGGDAIVAALCEAERTTDAEEARRLFLSEVHAPLHDLARDVGEVDRQVAARLLESKQRVEAVVEDGNVAEITEAMSSLTDATLESYETLGTPVSSCDERDLS